MVEAPTTSSSGIRRAGSVPPWPKIKPILTAQADTGIFDDAEPDARESSELQWRWLGMLGSRMIFVGIRWRKNWSGISDKRAAGYPIQPRVLINEGNLGSHECLKSTDNNK